MRIESYRRTTRRIVMLRKSLSLSVKDDMTMQQQ